MKGGKKENNERSRNHSNHSRAPLDQSQSRKALKPLGNVETKQSLGDIDKAAGN